MNDVLKAIIPEIPRYFYYLGFIIVQPHTSVKRLSESEDRYMTRAWTFFCISLILSEIFRYSIGKNSPDIWFLIASGAIWKLFFFTITASVIFLSLRIVGSGLRYYLVITVCMYFFSVINLLWHFTTFAIRGFTLISPCYEREYTGILCDFPDTMGVNAEIFWAAATKAANRIFSITPFIFVAWLSYCWFIWMRISSIGFGKTIIAGFATSIALPILIAFALNLRMQVVP